eukprot:TRINITY_DN2139_c0_g1::TRINITY_DN2139_c0_g1_i1::g.12904::m.12904 TRINITY_DN2139_c0_g1::TRINITY_DN2139_c0_g1_i1::g.12904  ORF type:complete len:282 (+),score=59.34,sp/P79110/TXTP_BOVIN/33.56/5e-42,Mito_carr/PF00153.22/2.2e-20,Mito_carr/PF00153.22/8.4e-19,Mito_carr/PF00153.22/8.4e-21,DUF1702/PF08012.6/0.019 TRINITY_DN2139_c0_g1_i1:91-936(+)
MTDSAKSLICGALAGVNEVLFTMPLDVVKTQMQLHPERNKSIVGTFGFIVKDKGVRGLYYGLPAMVSQVGGKVAIRFAAYDQFKNLFSGSSLASVYAGLCAGATEALVWTTPTERLKVLRQSQIGSSGAPKFTGMISGARYMIANEGITSLYAGLGPTVIRQSSSVAVRFTMYDQIKNLYVTITGDKKSSLQSVFSGGVVGVLSVLSNNPVDVIKSRMQAQTKASEGAYKSSLDCASKIFAKEGIAAFYRGCEARALRVGLGQAIVFTSFEFYSKLVANLF